jgi:hypothetical protein
MRMGLFQLLTSRRARSAFRTERFLASAPQYADLRGRPFDKAVVATVAFNRPDMVEWQIHLVRKYLAEHHGYIVFDNSSDSRKRADLRRLCARENVPYVSLPRLVLGRNSFSHAAAMNWIAKHFVASHQPAVFGFIDHDIFPMATFSVREKIAGKRVYGLRYSHGNAWYLWAGFCFFSKVPVAGLNFDPVPHGYLDTGGANWDRLYRDLGPEDANFAERSEIDTTENGRNFESIDGWLHAGNAGNWNGEWTKDRHKLLEGRLKDAGVDGPEIAPL